MLIGNPLHTPVGMIYLIQGVPVSLSSPFPNGSSHSCLCSLDITSRPGDRESRAGEIYTSVWGGMARGSLAGRLHSDLQDFYLTGHRRIMSVLLADLTPGQC